MLTSCNPADEIRRRPCPFDLLRRERTSKFLKLGKSLCSRIISTVATWGLFPWTRNLSLAYVCILYITFVRVHYHGHRLTVGVSAA